MDGLPLTGMGHVDPVMPTSRARGSTGASYRAGIFQWREVLRMKSGDIPGASVRTQCIFSSVQRLSLALCNNRLFAIRGNGFDAPSLWVHRILSCRSIGGGSTAVQTLAAGETCVRIIGSFTSYRFHCLYQYPVNTNKKRANVVRLC